MISYKGYIEIISPYSLLSILKQCSKENAHDQLAGRWVAFVVIVVVQVVHSCLLVLLHLHPAVNFGRLLSTGSIGVI